jgi:hypothetical protein
MGCGFMQLHKESKYKMEIDAGLDYYPYSTYLYTTKETMEVNAGLLVVSGDQAALDPAIGCDNIGITLSWCERDPVDLDLFLFMPGEDGVTQTTEDSTVYWAWPTGMDYMVNYSIALGMDDLGIDDVTGRVYSFFTSWRAHGASGGPHAVQGAGGKQTFPSAPVISCPVPNNRYRAPNPPQYRIIADCQ